VVKIKTVTVQPVAIIIEVAMMVHSRVPSIIEVALMVHSRVPSEVPTTMNPATKMRTITYMMIEIVWVPTMKAVIGEKGLPVVVLSVIMDMIVGPTPEVPAIT
jgi:hypothetical protein